MEQDNNLYETEHIKQEIVGEISLTSQELFLLEFLKGFDRRKNREMGYFVI